MIDWKNELPGGHLTSFYELLGFTKCNGFFVLIAGKQICPTVNWTSIIPYEVTLKVFEDDVELEMVSVEPFRSTPEILSVKSKGNTEYIYQPDSYVGVASRMHQRWIQNV